MEQKERKERQKKRKGIYTKTYIYKDGEEEETRNEKRKWEGKKRKKIETHTQKDKKRKQGRVEGRWEGEPKCSRTPQVFRCVIWLLSYRIHLGFRVLLSAAL